MYAYLFLLNEADLACTEEERRVTRDFYQLKN